MKELSIEQKAKRYDKAIERARNLYNSEETSAGVEIACENIFPELIEFKDERIRKALIRFHKNTIEIDGTKGEDIIAWLEKQGEQKPLIEIKSREESLGISTKEYNEVVNDCLYSESKSADKVEPKFHEGDWVVSEVTGSVYQIKHPIENLNTHKYGYELTNDGYISSTATNHYHLWTIQDAKDGDVLEFGDHGRLVVGIISHINKSTGKVDVYCLLEANNFKAGIYYALDTIKPHPATKEQRDILFKAMTDAGYEFDFEKKELKKIK